MAPLFSRVPWLPHSLRWQFLIAILSLTLLILAGGITAAYALRSASIITGELAEDRLVQMQLAQDLLQRTLLIERETYHLADATTLPEMQDSYSDIIKLLEEFDGFINKLATDSGGSALLELHQTSQLFRNTVNVAAQLREKELQHTISSSATQSTKHYFLELHDQAEKLMEAARFQSDRFTRLYREAIHQLENMTQRNSRWIAILLAASLIVAGVIAQRFLGRHVLGRLQQVSHDLRLSNDKPIAVENESSTQFPDEIDEMAHAVKLFQDDRRKLGQRTSELIAARDAAEQANRAKSVFLANMSHELRTPLNSILGFSSLVRRDPNLSDSQRETLDIIKHSGEHLLSLINDVLEMAKIEAGRQQLEIAVFDLGALVLDVLEIMHLRAEKKGLRLLLDQSSDFPRYIKGDEMRLRQIMLNLVSNAVKFTQEGGVTIRLGTHQNTHHHLIIEIEDSGPGITAQDQARLFQPFVQLETGDGNRQLEGTGLGLALTHEFVHMMGGEITLESVVGKGSLFRVDLPLEPADAGEVTKVQTSAQSNIIGLAPNQPTYRILIAEDQQENRLLLHQLVANIGMPTRYVENGKECIRVFQEWRPDLIFMDRGMPVMDGLEATRKIRELPGGDKVKIVAVTASVFKEQRDEILAAGTNQVVRKPYHLEDIYECMAEQLGLKFLYETDVSGTDAASGMMSNAELVSKLTALAENLRHELSQALQSLDHDYIVSVIEKIRDIDTALADALERHTDNFDYPAILTALGVE
jgi:signal transduction histidine kinase/DNA-binding NarL/FixJ family response regulator